MADKNAGLITDAMKNPAPQFQDRIDNPQDYGVVNRDNGGIATHLMAAEIDEDGRVFAYPTIVLMPDGSLKEFDDTFEALKYNRSIGNVIEFNSIEEAIPYAEGAYKTDEFKKYYSNLTSRQK